MNPAGLCAGQEYHQILKMPGGKKKKKPTDIWRHSKNKLLLISSYVL